MVLAHHDEGFDVRALEAKRGARRLVALDGRGSPTALVGGKGASLDALVRLGFRVPPAAAITTIAYHAFVDSSPTLERFLEDLRSSSPPALEKVHRDRQRVDDAFLGTPVPSDLRAEVAAALGSIASGGFPVAVRSSATAEDLEATSFAGQHRSVLDARGLDSVLDALRLVWASLWHPAPRVYRARMGVEETDLAMAVILQRMVAADRSGVCFTVDPTSSAALRLEVVDGLGEALVSGQATPDVYQLSLPALRPIDGSPLDPGLRRVARTALLIEEEMGGQPQDVEWCLAGGEAWVLQARPITTSTAVEGDGFDTPNQPGHQYAATGVAEMLPGVLPPLLWTVNAPLLEEGFRSLFGRLGVVPDDVGPEPFALLGRFGGQAALDVSIVKAAARGMAGGTGAEVERQYLGQVVTELGPEPRRTLGQRLQGVGASTRALRLRKQVLSDAERFERSVEEILTLDLDLHDLRSSELLAVRARVRDLAAAGIATEVAVAVAAVASYRALEVALGRWVDGSRAARWAQRVTRDASGGTQGTCAGAAAVWTVFQDVSGARVLEEAIATATPEDAEARLRAAGPAGEALVDRLWEALDRLGSAAVYGGPTWREQPETVWRGLLSCLRSRIARGHREPLDEARRGAEEALQKLERELTSSLRWRVTRVLTGQIVDLRRRMLRNLVTNARELLSLRESVKTKVLALGGVERRVTLVLAERLARRGALRAVADVELLADWELEDVVTGVGGVSRDELERREQVLRSARDRALLPPLVDHRGAPVALQTPGDGLSGWGASPGVHRGRVRIVRDVAEADLAPGDVLVAVSTDPSWTPLFLVAGAVVVERGGPLSHAAIVARELGVPAVLNAVGATAALGDGQLVEVDGSTGSISVLEAGPTTPQAEQGPAAQEVPA